MKPGRDARRRRMLEEAWLGDAVLALYARSRILTEHGAVDATRFERMTSNQFLTALGDPAEVEAEIGRAWQDGGLEAAFRHIEARIMPVHDRQEAKRLRAAATRPAPIK